MIKIPEKVPKDYKFYTLIKGTACPCTKITLCLILKTFFHATYAHTKEPKLRLLFHSSDPAQYCIYHNRMYIYRI